MKQKIPEGKSISVVSKQWRAGMFLQSVGVTRVSGFSVKTIAVPVLQWRKAYPQLSRTLTLTHAVELEGGTELGANLLTLERLLTWNVKPQVSKEFIVDLGQEECLWRGHGVHTRTITYYRAKAYTAYIGVHSLTFVDKGRGRAYLLDYKYEQYS